MCVLGPLRLLLPMKSMLWLLRPQVHGAVPAVLHKRHLRMQERRGAEYFQR